MNLQQDPTSRPTARLYDVITYIAFILAALSSFPLYGWSLHPGLDQSYMWAFNHMAEEDFQFGKDVLFTFGPLGYLLFPQPIGNNLETGMVFTVVYRFAFALLLAWGTLRIEGGWRARILRLLAGCLLLKIATFDACVISATAMLVILMRRAPLRIITPISLVMIALLLLFKTIPAIPVTVLAFFGLLAERKRFERRDFAALAVGLLLAVIILLLGSGFSASALGRYLWAWKEFSSGAASVSSSYEPNAWGWIIAAAITYAVAIATAKHRAEAPHKIPLLLLALPSLYIYFKYAYSRMDHAILFPPVVAAVMLVQVMSTPSTRKALIQFALTIVTVASLQIGIDRTLGKQAMMNTHPAGVIGQSLETNGFANFYDSVIQFDNYKKALKAESKTNLAPLRFPEDKLVKFANQTVDSYPFELSPIYANKFHWKPRPIFQSQQGLTPWADQVNASFFEKGKGADLILFDQRIMEGIDTRYVMSDEPHTIMQIISRYGPVAQIGHYKVLEKHGAELLIDPVGMQIGETTTLWGLWLEPPVTSGILRAKVHAKQTAPRQIKRLLYKQGPIFLEYRLADGTVKKHRLVVDNMGEGVWIDPYLPSLDSSIRVDAIRFLDPYNEFTPELRITWIRHAVSQDSFLAPLVY